MVADGYSTGSGTVLHGLYQNQCESVVAGGWSSEVECGAGLHTGQAVTSGQIHREKPQTRPPPLKQGLFCLCRPQNITTHTGMEWKLSLLVNNM